MSDFNKILDHETRERRVGTIVTGGLLGMIVFLVVSLVLVL